MNWSMYKFTLVLQPHDRYKKYHIGSTPFFAVGCVRMGYRKKLGNGIKKAEHASPAFFESICTT